MKDERVGFRPVRREQLFQELVHDSYKSSRKLREPTRCPECGAVYHKGRWTWGKATSEAHEEKCPACHRIHDQFPAGYVILKGGFLREHHDEILQLVKNHEAKEKAEHPLERIMKIEDAEDGVLVTTTDTHLARDIAEALHNAYKGDLDYHYNKQDMLLRATWSRSQ
ncbi:MAG: ATPase [Betaproteobacteria bacterium RIFCSPLOWO2_12_FULL_63_13]|nr:MAG: ATPase [Betaproteobacteria bacterium RIFCSPLOWO2_02_FULL_63_19]OGA46792.1 MAG: ATPase [Betaproteobacteria bacterium RIFCSPLOWO2_12_FULL_63_13]